MKAIVKYQNGWILEIPTTGKEPTDTWVMTFKNYKDKKNIKQKLLWDLICI